ncbi:MAG: hypothetical protein ACI9BW_002713 [Gammaproteobacteria bacterium]|jgi:hypothetical protein
MDLTQLANLGEFIGGVAVLVTLIYLAVELRRSRATSQAASVDALAAGLNAINSELYNNPELFEIFMRGSKDPDDLASVERGRFLALAQHLVNHFMTIKRSRERGVLPDAEWQAYGIGCADFFHSSGGEWALGEVAATDDVRQALRELRSGSDIFAAWRGEDVR